MPGAGTIVDASKPLADHSLNIGRVAWWRNVRNSGYSTGLTLRNLARNHRYDAAQQTTNRLWAGPGGRPGGDGCQKYNGTTDYYLANSGPILGGLANWSIAVWFNTTTAADQIAYSERAASGNDIIQLFIFTGSDLDVTYRNDGGTLIQLTAAGLSPNDGKWHRLVATKLGTAFKLAFDGVVKSSGTFGSGSDAFTDASIQSRIASDIVGGDFVNGRLDSLSLWTRALSDGEIDFDYQEEKQGNPNTLNWLDSPYPAVFGAPAAAGSKLLLWRRRKAVAA